MPGANSYLQQQTLVMLRGKVQNYLNNMDRICFSSNIEFFTPPPALLCLHTQFQLFNIYKLFFFHYFRVRLQGFSKKSVFRRFNLLKSLFCRKNYFESYTTHRWRGGIIVNETFLSKMPC